MSGCCCISVLVMFEILHHIPIGNFISMFRGEKKVLISVDQEISMDKDLTEA